MSKRVKSWSSICLVLATCCSLATAEDLTLCMAAWRQTQLGNYEQAMELFEKGIEEGDLSKSSLSQTYRNMGITCNRAKDYAEAIEYYDKALELKPSEPWKDLVNRGNSLSNLERFDEASRQYDEAQKLKPHYHEAYFNRGILLEKQDKLEEAIAQFMKAYENGLRSPGLRERFEVYGLMNSAPPIPAPKNYQWARFAEIKAFFLKPDGWHVANKTSHTYIISKDKPAPKDEDNFKTGLRVEVLIEAGKAGNPKSAKQIIEEKSKSHKESNDVVKVWAQDSPAMEALGVVYQQESNGSKRTVHSLLIGNKNTGTVYDIQFRSPTAEWEETWKVAEPMLRLLFIDDEL